MSGWYPPTRYEHCDADEKIRRSKIFYVDGSIDIYEFERRVVEAIREEDRKEEDRLARLKP